MKNHLFHTLLIVSLMVGLFTVSGCNQQPDKQPAEQAKEQAVAPTPQTEVKEETVAKDPQDPKVSEEEIAVMETSVGTMAFRFFSDVAPGHVENFKKLAKEGFYDGTRFHRVIKGFMIQGGDPNSKNDDISMWGRGGPGYSIKAEFNNRIHEKGTLSMARSSDPDSAGSQFFLCHGRAQHLDGQYTVWGELMDGMDVLDKIANAPVTRSPSGENSLPVTPVTVKSVKIVPLSEYKKSA